MRNRNFALLSALSLILACGVAPASADGAKPGQSMTHIKSAAGLSAALETAGVVLYVQGGATSSIIGDSIAAADGRVVFHIPITANKSGVQHIGSNIVFFNTTNNLQLQLKNPVINLKTGAISAVIPQAANASMTVLTITNTSTLKAKIKTDRKAGLRTTAYENAALAIAPGVGAAIASILGLTEGALPDGTPFGSADVTLYSKAPKGK
jgi:hypothetical protein